MDGIALRDYRPGDWQAMYDLDLICFEPAFQFSKETMRDFAEAPDAVTVLAESKEGLAGFCIAELNNQMGYIVSLDVAPKWRRQGLARELMTEIETRIRDAGGLGAALHVFTGNLGAIRFYEGIGYGRVGIVDRFYGRGRNALMYRKRL